MDAELLVINSAKGPRVNIAFQDLKYSVTEGKEEKCILKSINGRFKSHQMSAIMGPSGSGKTTLLNILAGFKFKTNKVSGSVIINNETRVLKHFYKMSRYIMQENTLQEYLTVLESMLIAADFKLGFQISKQEKLKTVTAILRNLRLTDVINSEVDKLSGGERKRLSVALELINNPSVIFLDEPTSGLDEQASFQCLSVLKQLAEEGRTVICSIHSPSSKTFSLFDHIYVMSEGHCVFQGQGSYLLPFLETIKLQCPLYYNPMDFFMDVACGEYGKHLDKLIALTENGKLTYPYESETRKCGISNENFSFEPEYSISLLSQIRILLYRIFLQSRRNYIGFITKSLVYVFLTVLFSAMFYNCGNDATKIFHNMSYLYMSIAALNYCALMPPLIRFPLEIKRIESEYFNRWYNIPAYFIAKSISVIPSFVIYTILYFSVSYPLSDQPLFWDRMMKFVLVGVVINMIADALSMSIASVFNVVNSFFLGIALIIPVVIFAAFGYGFSYNLHPFFVQLLLRTSYFRYAIEALMDVVYRDRPDLFCPETELLCPFTSPKIISTVTGYSLLGYWMTLTILIGFYVIFRAVHYFLLKQRLSPGKPTEIALRIVDSVKNMFVKLPL